MWDNSWDIEEVITEFIETLDGAYKQHALDYLRWLTDFYANSPDDAALDKRQASKIRATIRDILGVTGHSWVDHLPEN